MKQSKEVMVLEPQQGKYTQFAKDSAKAVVIATALAGTQAYAADFDLSGLTTSMNEVKTAVLGVIAVAVTIGVAIVGWRWAKKGLFSI